MTAVVFTVPGQAVPWMRARARDGARFNASELVAYESTVRMLAITARQKVKCAGIAWPMDADAYELSAVIVDKDRRRRDVDNILKSLCDGLTHALWDDDSLVQHVLDVPRIVDAHYPRLVVRVRVVSRVAIELHARELLEELEGAPVGGCLR